MTEDDLYKMSIDDLFDLMTQRTNELSAMYKAKGDITIIRGKEKELTHIQVVIVTKKAGFPPE